MQIVRTIVWVLLLAALLVFSAFNWKPVEVKIWEGLILETKIPALVVVSFLVGLVPMWLLHRANHFYLTRRINSLESAARSAAVTPVAPPSPPEEAVVAPPAAEPSATVDAYPAQDPDRPRTEDR